MNETYEIVDNLRADHVEVGDQIIIDGDLIEVSFVGDMDDDPDGVIIKGYSNESGDLVTHEVYFGDAFDVWTV